MATYHWSFRPRGTVGGEEALQNMASQSSAAAAGRFHILHLSDLHFGSRQVTSRQVDYVETHLREKVEACLANGEAVQPVITGDLMDSPSQKSLADFESFRHRLEATARTLAVCIPGNHDMKRKASSGAAGDPLPGSSGRASSRATAARSASSASTPRNRAVSRAARLPLSSFSR
jgi:DNA repair exonuclease SbcCD nuclease subunit